MPSRTRHYLQAPQVAIIFLAFPLLTVPLAAIQLSPAIRPQIKELLLLSHIVLLGNTHFAITWALYLNATNLRYFSSSPLRRLTYFGIPVGILIAFCAIGLWQQPAAGTTVFLLFTVSVAAFDFFHVDRQSFGVFQMFKARAGAPRSFARADNAYFLSLFALQLVTFQNGVTRGFDGRFDPQNPLTRVLGIAAAVLFLIVCRGLRRAWRQPDRDAPALAIAFAYLMLQSAAALLAIYRSRLYPASLAMHYVEYHVLMAPRVFGADLDLSTRVDRVAAMLRRHKVTFYGGVVAVAALVSAGSLLDFGGISVAPNNSAFGWLFINLLNGVFVSHYFLEAFVWKFGNPFYRETLGPIYFPDATRRRAAQSQSAAAKSAGRRARA